MIIETGLAVGFGGLAAEEEIMGSALLALDDDIRGVTPLAWSLARAGQLPGSVAVDHHVVRDEAGPLVAHEQAAVVEAALIAARAEARAIVAAGPLAVGRFARLLLVDYQGRMDADPDAIDTGLSGTALEWAIAEAGLARLARHRPSAASPTRGRTDRALVRVRSQARAAARREGQSQ